MAPRSAPRLVEAGEQGAQRFTRRRGAIERVLHGWFERHAPRTAAQFSIPAMRRLRERVIERYPQRSHDASWLRRKGIEIALAESGSDPTLADAAYDAFFAERNRVDFYDDARDALDRRVEFKVRGCK